jgi:hypothetical protein
MLRVRDISGVWHPWFAPMHYELPAYPEAGGEVCHPGSCLEYGCGCAFVYCAEHEVYVVGRKCKGVKEERLLEHVEVVYKKNGEGHYLWIAHALFGKE